MTFKAWAKQYVKEETPRGDFARDMLRDQEFPRNIRSLDELLNHLYLQHACEGAVRAARDAWRAYARTQE